MLKWFVDAEVAAGAIEHPRKLIEEDVEVRPERSVYFCAIPSSSPVQNELSLATPNFSLFVLELPLPNRKAEVIFHYSFWNFRSQIEKRKLYLLFVLELPLPDQKEKADLPQFVLEQIEKAGHHSFWNSPSKSKRGR